MSSSSIVNTDPFVSIHQYGWALIKQSNTCGHCTDVIQSILALANRIDLTKSLGSPISGNYIQYSLNRQHSNLKQQLKSYALGVLQTLKALKPEDCLHARKLKLLIAPPESGPQAPHLDGMSRGTYVVAFYLTKTTSTDVSTMPYLPKSYDEMDSKDYQAVSPKYWTHFTHFDVEPGDMMIFAEDVVHRGIYNNSTQDRKVLFMLLTDDKNKSDDYQVFEWNFVHDAFGPDSNQYRDCLQRNQQYQPDKHDNINSTDY